MTKDSTFSHLHLHSSHHADLLEDFTRGPSVHLPPEEIYVPPQHQPLNPDDEDDVVPEQHAAFGIQRATQRAREPIWRDLGLERILDGGPPDREALGALRGGLGGGGAEGRVEGVGGGQGAAAAAAAGGNGNENGGGERVRMMR